MANPTTLLSWIGHADLIAMADDLGETGKDLLALAKVSGKYGEKPGPLKTAVTRGRFDYVHLLSNYPEAVHEPFARWLGVKPVIHPVSLQDPTDYEGIFRCANGVLAEVSRDSEIARTRLAILLSPGTPAMAVVWVLLGRSRYPATFYQTGRGDLYEARIPADLFEEVIPELLRDRDVALQHLAAKNPAEVEGFGKIIGDSPAIRIAVGRAQRAALRNVNVLILGESGTGKEMFAHAVHEASSRRAKPFVPINCAAIPRELLEAELFGHKKGAYTGAQADRNGAFKRADGGTIFLDELGECDLPTQVKLLRVLQPPPGKGPCCREFSPVGSDQPITCDVRVIAATNCDLIEAINQGRFREDLYYRLASITLRLPPLRDRPKDIPLLAEALLKRINGEFREQSEPGYRDKSLSDRTTLFLQRQAWPGNVRQLYNALVQAAVLSEGELLEPCDLAEALSEVPGKRQADPLNLPLGDGFNLARHLEDMQRHYLQRAMDEAGGVKARAAELLGYDHYQTLDAQLKRLGVRVEAGKRRPA